MPQENENLKLRFKLKTGEEFEAQGDLSFISSQKEAFLNLVKSPKILNSGLANDYRAENQAEAPIRLPLKPSYLSRQENWSNKKITPQNNILKTPSGEVWDKVAYSDGENLILRRKSKLIKPQIAALSILGANKTLNAQDTLSALTLAKSFFSVYNREKEDGRKIWSISETIGTRF